MQQHKQANSMLSKPFIGYWIFPLWYITQSDEIDSIQLLFFQGPHLIPHSNAQCFPSSSGQNTLPTNPLNTWNIFLVWYISQLLRCRTSIGSAPFFYTLHDLAMSLICSFADGRQAWVSEHAYFGERCYIRDWPICSGSILYHIFKFWDAMLGPDLMDLGPYCTMIFHAVM